MSEHKGMIPLPQGNVNYIIQDMANIVLKSATLTEVLVRAITRVAKDLVMQGINEIVIFITDIRDIVELVVERSNIRRKHMKLALAAEMYDLEITRVESLPPGAPGTRFRDVWLAKLEEDFHREFSSI